MVFVSTLVLAIQGQLAQRARWLPSQKLSATSLRYTVRPILPSGALAQLPGHEEKLLLLVPIPLDAALVSALRRYPVTTLKRIQLPADIPNPVWPTHCPQDRPRRLPCWLRSAVLGRSDARSSKGLEYHQPRTREQGVGSGTGKARAATHLAPRSLAGPLTPSPGHALQPHQPLSHPSASPRARRPPAPPAVLMRARLCTAQGRVRRPLRVVPSSWRLRIPSHRAAHA